MSDIPVHFNEESVHERFMLYCRFGDKSNSGDMDNATFAKLCKETGIINKTCTKTDVDLIFTRAKPKGGRRIDYHHFNQAMLYLSEKRFPQTYKDQGKDAAIQKIKELICKKNGPEANATKADFVKFHDDKSTYTGVYKNGGPTNIDNIITLSNLMDRSPADARGRKYN